MNLKTTFIILSVAALATVSTAWGQGFRGGSGGSTNPAMLLTRDDVRADLQITDDQKAKLYDLQEGLRARFTEAFQTADTDPEARKKAMENIGKKIVEEVNGILTTNQQTRLKEIAIQLSGFAVLSTQMDLQKAVSITDDQKAKIADLKTRMDKASGDAWTKVRSGEIQWTDAIETGKKNLKILTDEIGKLLTPAQKEKFKSLAGKPFVPAPEPGAGSGSGL